MKTKGILPVKGYFLRAKVFGFLLLAIAVLIIAYSLYHALLR